MGLKNRLQHAWNAFANKDPTYSSGYGGYLYRPDRPRFSRGNERSIVTAVLNKISMDCAAINVEHVRLDDNNRFVEVLNTGLNKCLTLEANLDQTGRAFIQDVVMSLMDEGCIAIVPVETTLNPNISGGFDITNMRVGKVLEWYPDRVGIRVYN